MMNIFDNFAKQNRIFAFIVKLQNSVLYPIIFGIICAYSGISGIDVYKPCLYALTAMVVISGLMSHDMKVFLVPSFLIYYAIGMDVAEDYYQSLYPLPSLSEDIIPHFFICGAAIATVLIYRLISNGYLREILQKRGICFWGILLFDIALVLGGAFSSQFDTRSTLFSLLTAVVLTLGYMLFITIISHSEDGIAYACKTLVVLGFVVAFQVLTLAYRVNLNEILFLQVGELFTVNRATFTTVWGLATIIGGVMIPPIVACFYLMHKRRFPVLSFLSAIALLAVTMFITTRSAILVGAVVFVLGMVLVCINGKNRIINRVTVALFAGAVIFAVVAFFTNMNETHQKMLDEILTFLRLNIDIDDLDTFSSQRIVIWKDGIADFLQSPIFGVGFRYGYFSPEEASLKLYDNMYHNIGIQIIASLGIVGAVMFLIHLKHVAEIAIRRFSVDKLLLLLVPLSIIGMSLVDNFFFYPNFILIYTAFLAAAEVSLEQTRAERLSRLKKREDGKRPRVVFTYVEAGKGHIVPTQNVYEAFKSKYGDRVEIVQSRFFTETNDKNMEKTEILFRRAVQNQNRSPVLSFLCKLGNLIAGDTFALFVLLRMTFSGVRTNKRAVKHIRELDADVIYSAHWSIPFYVNQLKCDRPYTICFCPDVYSNGAFNVDCNRFLISSDVGYNQIAHRMRMYAGGNITQIPFPMRPDVENYKGEDKRAMYREKLGIPQDEFVVVLCDGGYGMARLEKTAKLLTKKKRQMTVIALCGTNKKLYEKLSEYSKSVPSGVRLIAVDFTDKVLEYIACADVFAGKSGANSVAEPAALCIPIVVTKCITYIERGIKNYYVHRIGGAIYRPSAHVAARKIAKFAENSALLEKYKSNLKNSHRFKYDAEATADIIWESIK